MSDTPSSSLVGFLSDPSTLLALGAVAVGTAWYLSSGPAPTKPPIPLDNQSIEVPDGEHVRTSHFAKDGLMKTCFPEVTTLYENFQRGKKVSNDGPCLGERGSPTGRYRWVSYGEVEERAIAFGAGLCALGLDPGQESFVGIYSQNNTEWVVTEQAANCYSRVVVPLYDTLGPEAVSYIINLACISVVVCHASKVSMLFKRAESAPVLKTIVKMGDITTEERDTANKLGLDIYSFKEVEAMGREKPVDLVLPSADDLSTVCFTSGTTGNPKGACLTHINIISMVAAIQKQLQSVVLISPEDVHVSYLPLAHMMERACHAMLYMNGARVGFFQGDVKKLVDDIKELKPTVFVSVPRLLNRVYDKVIAGVSSSPVKKWLFEKALASKESELKQGIVRRNSIWDYLVFSRVQQSLGGRVRILVTGSAPIAEKVLTFLRCSLGCYVFEGYGQTECGAACTMSIVGDLTSGHVGPPVPCNNIKLVDVKDMNYFADNKEGEVCVKGYNVFKGYLKEPEKTAEALDEDGWLHTGDIGRWLPNGTLKIVDRKKHIFKLSQGEYIAPEKVENIYLRSIYVAQCYLYGDSLKSCCVAVVIPDEEVLMAWAKENGRTGTFKELCSNEDIKKMIQDDMVACGKEAGLHSFEQAKAIMLHEEPFSVENGFMTPTFKTKRPVVKNAFMEHFVRMYQELGNV